MKFTVMNYATLESFFSMLIDFQTIQKVLGTSGCLDG